METEDTINLPALRNCRSRSKSGELKTSLDDDVDSLFDMELGDGKITPVVKTGQVKDMVENLSAVQASVGSTEIVTVRAELNADNDCLDVHNEAPIHKRRMEDNDSRSNVKRVRITIEEQPSVHVKYKGLTRASKRKLEELLQQWTEWHARNDSMSQDTNEVVECGEKTYFPTVQIDPKKSSTVSFWIDNKTRDELSKEHVPFDGDSVPVYDRGYALGLTSADYTSNLEGGLEILGDAIRCFNCDSYSHSLKECPKPRDNAAVSNARKQHKSKRNQNSAPHNQIRYYQNSRGGKYDDLRPGSLCLETRKLLGLGELDPPPWLNRMRELGYPPGYLDPDDEDQPSGITIFADGEDAKIIETKQPEPIRKMTVKFPGINELIPKSADERTWTGLLPCSDLSRIASHSRADRSELSTRPHHERMWSGGFRDVGPGDLAFNPSSYPLRYGGYDSFDLSNITVGRSHLDISRRSPVTYEDFVNHSSLPLTPHLSNRYGSLPDYGFTRRFENARHERRSDYELDYSWRRSRYVPDGYLHHSRRWL